MTAALATGKAVRLLTFDVVGRVSQGQPVTKVPSRFVFAVVRFKNALRATNDPELGARKVTDWLGEVK